MYYIYIYTDIYPKYSNSPYMEISSGFLEQERVEKRGIRGDTSGMNGRVRRVSGSGPLRYVNPLFQPLHSQYTPSTGETVEHKQLAASGCMPDFEQVHNRLKQIFGQSVAYVLGNMAVRAIPIRSDFVQVKCGLQAKFRVSNSITIRCY